MKLYLSNIKNKDKPDSYKIKKISNTILNNLVDISLEEFAEELSEQGKTVVLAELSENKLSKTTPIIGQELIMLDFDNKDLNNTYTIDDLECDIFIQNHAVFYYRTFSDLYSEVDKFRVVFQLNRIITSNNEIEEIYQKLFTMYPQADSSVGQTNRMFFGSNSSYELIDSDNRLLVDDLLNQEQSIIETTVNSEVIDINTPVYLLLKYKKYDLVQEKFGNIHSNIFPDDITASNYFKTQNIREFLELSEENPFYDIFHEESNPSASVYFSKDLQIYIYKCFSESSNFQGDIIRVLSKYLGLNSFSKTIDLLIDVTNSEINYKSEIGKAKRDFLDLKDQLRYHQLETNFRELYHYIKRYEDEVIEIMNIMFDFTYLDKTTNELKYLNYLSIGRITQYVNKRLYKNNSKDKISRIMNLIIVMEMVTKLPSDGIPSVLKQDLIAKQERNSNQIRTSNIYTPSIDLESAFEIAKILKKNNITVNSLGFEVVYRIFGKEKALQDFPQAYQPLIERGILIQSEKDENLPKNNVDFEKAVTKIISKELKKKGYIFEENLIILIASKLKIKKTTARTKYTKLRADIINKYDLKRHRNNVDTAFKLKIKGKFSSKIIIYKI